MRWKISTNTADGYQTDTKCAQSVHGRPTLKDEERFQNGLVHKPYERSLYERTFMGCLENTDLENADLRPQTSKTQTSKTQTSKMQTSKTQTLETKTCHKHLKQITAFARERIMAAMNLNPIVRLFFLFCYMLFCFQFFSNLFPTSKSR